MTDIYDSEIDTELFCKDCVNYLELKKNTCECDFDVWDQTTPAKAELYKAVSFNCVFGDRIEK